MKYIDDIDVSNKRVILRCDFNVPIKNGIIADNSRILKSLKTINYLLEKNCSLILMSHLGRIKTREDKLQNSLAIVGKELEKLLNKEVKFLKSPVGMDVLKTCKAMKSGDVVLLENTRFCDFPEKLESKNDFALAKYWSCLGEVFVVDAFGSLHRSHASVAGIAKYLPSYLGLLVKEELRGLAPAINDISRPFTVFMGGAKVDDKLGYIKDLLKKCDYLLVGGGIANSFLYACGYDVKESLCTNDEITLSEIKSLVDEYKDKIVLPVDFIFENDQILDLGTKSINKFLTYFKKSKTIFINGTCGKFEDKRFAKGTIALFAGLKSIDSIKLVGGGDTVNLINEYKLNDSFSYISSGGGASIEYISTNHLNAIDFMEQQ